MIQPSVQANPGLYQWGAGAVPPTLPTYVEREADHQIVEELLEGKLCYVLTARQMGKSSLVVRAQQHLRQHGIASASIDLSGFGKTSSQEQWYYNQVDTIANQLNFPDREVSDWWDGQEKLSVTQRFTRFLSDFVLERRPRVVIFIDEIDSTIGLPFSDDYFAAIRAVYQRRAAEPRLQGLTFALLGVAAPSDLIKDPTRTPFNIGRRIELTDFTREEATPLIQGLAPEPDLAAKLLDRILFWTGGQPYLSQKTCQFVAMWAQERWDPRKVPAIVDETVKQSFLTPASRKSDPNLQLVSDRVGGRNGGKLAEERRKLLEVYAEILKGRRVADEELDPVKVALKLSGLVVVGTAGLTVRNAIYRTVFDEVWVRSLLDESAPVPEDATLYDVFVSYSHEDGQWVREFLVPHLKESGLRVGSDLELLPGSNWTEELKRMRESSNFFLPVLSPAWALSRSSQEEFEIMSNRVGKIVPAMLRPTRLPSFLEAIRYADFTDPSQARESLNLLITALGGRKESLTQKAPAIVPGTVSAAVLPSNQSQDDLIAELEKSFDRDALVKLASERFPEEWQSILERIDPKAPAVAVATALVDFAAQNARMHDLADAVAAERSSAKPDTPPPRPATTGSYHVFVAIPFGSKREATTNQEIDFNSIYQELVKPALEGARFSVFRADEELRAGDIRTDLFQELLLADLVVADLSIDNPNIWYELGVRHALRARGVIQIQAVRQYMPFDVYADRTLRYHIKDGKPDPAFLESDRAALAAIATETMNSWYGRKVSPVYHLLPYLKEPDWKSLRVDQATEFWAAQDDWERRVQVARRVRRAGDIMVLAEEAPSRALRAEAYCAAASALQSLGEYKFALEQCERALELDPQSLESRSLKGLLLNRLKRRDEAREWLNAILKDHPGHAETWGLLGRVDKEAWIESWRKPDASPAEMRSEAANADSLLRKSIESYVNGFTAQPGNFYTGINAVTLLYLLADLTGIDADAEQRDVMEGAVRWSVMTALRKNPGDYWTSISAADLAVLCKSRRAVERAYREAAAVAENNWFNLDSARQQLVLLRDVQFRPEIVQVAIQVLDRALSRLGQLPELKPPGQVILFSGHMVDKSDRPSPRFPPSGERVAAEAIEAALRELNAGDGDLALCGGANGGDILFAEACLKRGLRLEVRISSEEPRYLRESVTFAGGQWRDRFYAVKANANTKLFVMPDELGATPANVDPYSRNNLWQLYSALTWGDERLRFVCLWDGKGGDGPGGTRQLFEVAKQRTGRVYRIDTNALFKLESPA